MATWKKVIVSGSSAELAALKVDNLTSGSVVIGGGSAANLSVTAINGTGNIVATTGATSVAMSGAFTGSFSGSVVIPALTQGTGVVPFLYSGSTTATVAVSVWGRSSSRHTIGKQIRTYTVAGHRAVWRSLQAARLSLPTPTTLLLASQECAARLSAVAQS